MAAELKAVPAPAPAAPAGWRLVPLEPTPQMLAAGQMAWVRDPLRKSSTLYRAMVEAAPPCGVMAVHATQPPLDGVEPVSDADNQWFGDMMILQVLADSDNVNEQEREVLTRWMAASDRPTNRASGVTPSDGSQPE